MTHERDESVMDKVKDALGMGDDDRSERLAEDDMHAHTAGGGVSGSFDANDLGGTANRPAGPDFAGGDTAATGMGTDFEEGAMAGTGSTGAGVLEPQSTGTGVTDSEWTRGGSASGESPFGSDADTLAGDRRRDDVV